MFGRMMSERWGKIHWAITFVTFNLVFFPMHFLGMRGMQRRIYDYTQYTHLKGLQPMNQFMTISLFVLGIGQIILVFNFFLSMRRGQDRGHQPVARQHARVADVVAAAARELHGLGALRLPRALRVQRARIATPITGRRTSRRAGGAARGSACPLHAGAACIGWRWSPSRWRRSCLIVAGGLVTSTESGLSVPDWPTTYGQNMFTFPDLEVGRRHPVRALAPVDRLDRRAPDGRPRRALARGEPRRWVRRLGVRGRSRAVVAQGVLGGLTVLFFLLPTAISVAHACLAQTFFCLVVDARGRDVSALARRRARRRAGPGAAAPRR